MLVSGHCVLLVDLLINTPISLRNPVVSLDRLERDMSVHSTFITDWITFWWIRAGALLSAVYRDPGKCDTGVFPPLHTACGPVAPRPPRKQQLLVIVSLCIINYLGRPENMLRRSN